MSDEPSPMQKPACSHILVFPYPAQGHLLPLLDLTHRLVSLYSLKITVVITPKNLPLLSPHLSAHPSSVTPLILPFPSHPSIPDGVEHVKDLGNVGNLHLMIALSKLYDPLIDWFSSHPDPPIAILSDFFLGWTLRLANQLNVPRITFFSSGAFVASLCEYLYNNIEKVQSLREVEFDALPGAPVLKEEYLPQMFRIYKPSDPALVFHKDGMIANTLSWGCVFNSFDALEGKYLEYLKKQMGHDRVFGVGPLSLTGLGSLDRGSLGRDADSEPKDRVLTLLDGCPDGSVVYVCFGSQKLLTREQMEALAMGLKVSGTRFVWVVKPGTTRTEDGYGVVPNGFEKRVAGRGLVIRGWAPQVSVLNHKAVGGFVSHCGWNSVVEGLLGGALILAWPIEADQFINARLLVEEMGVGVRVCEGGDSVPDLARLGRVIAELMSEGGLVKSRAREWREKALMAAMTDGGSSVKDLDRLVAELGYIIPK